MFTDTALEHVDDRTAFPVLSAVGTKVPIFVKNDTCHVNQKSEHYFIKVKITKRQCKFQMQNSCIWVSQMNVSQIWQQWHIAGMRRLKKVRLILALEISVYVCLLLLTFLFQPEVTVHSFRFSLYFTLCMGLTMINNLFNLKMQYIFAIPRQVSMTRLY